MKNVIADPFQDSTLIVQCELLLSARTKTDVVIAQARETLAAQLARKIIEEGRFFTTEFDPLRAVLTVKAEALVFTREEYMKRVAEVYDMGVRTARSEMVIPLGGRYW